MIIVVESRRHGKAGKGKKKTSTWQVRDHCLADPGDYILKKQFKFTVGDDKSKHAANLKALAFATKLQVAP